MPRPTLRLFGVLLLGAILYSYGATSQVAWLFLVALLTWALLPAALAYALWNRNRVTPGIRLAAVVPGPSSPLDDLPEALFRDAPLPAPAFEGDRLDVELRLATDGADAGPASVSTAVAGAPLTAGAGRIPRAGIVAHRELGSARRGVVGAGGLRLESGDPLGLFRTLTERPGHELGVVFPVFASLSDRVDVREVESQLVAPRAGHGNEVFGVREYRPGDPLRRIHWRTSARRGELVVKEMEPPGQRVVLLVLDPDPDPDAADQAARIAASEAWDCLRTGGRAIAWAPGKEPSDARGSRSLWTLLDWLARHPAGTDSAAPPPAASEVVGVLTRSDGEAAATVADLAAHGAAARAWLVGGVGDDLDVPAHRAGLEWPLAR